MADRKVTVEVSVEGKNNLGAAAAQASAAAKQAAQQAATSPAATAAAAAAAVASAAANNPFGTKVKPLFSSQTDQNLSRLAQLQSGASSQASLVATAKAAAAAAATSPSVAATAAAAAAASNSASPFGTKVRPLFGAQTNANLANLATLQAQNAAAAGGGGGGLGWGPNKITNGDIFTGLKLSVTGAAEGLQKFQYAAVAAGAAASAAVAATAPATWATFTGSIQLLSGEFANMLIPAFVNVSAHLQRGAAWVKSWDANTRGFVTSLAVKTGTFLLLGAAIGKTFQLLAPVAQGLGMLGTAAARAGVAMAAFTVTNPWVAGLTIGIGVVAALTNGFGLLNDSIGRVSERAETAREQITRLRGGGQLGRADFESLPPALAQRLQSVNVESRREILLSEIRNREIERDRMFGRNPGAIQSDIERRLGATNGQAGFSNWFGMGDLEQQRFNSIRDALIAGGLTPQQATARTRAAAPNSADLIGNSSFELSPEVIRQIAQQASGANQAVTAQRDIEVMRRVLEQGVPGIIPGTGPASANAFQPRTFGGGDQFYGDILQQVLGRGELEQQIFDLQMRSLETHQQTVNELRGLREDVRQPNAPR